MLKDIIIGLLLLTSGVLAWQLIVQGQELVQNGEMEEYYLDFHHEEIKEFGKELLNDIEDQIENHGDERNTGLRDTINWVLEQHEKVVRDNPVSEDEATNYEKALEVIWNRILQPSPSHRRISDQDFPHTDWSEYSGISARKSRLMQLELGLLELLQHRIPSFPYNSGKADLAFLPDQLSDTIFLTKRKLMPVLIGRKVRTVSYREESYYIDFRYANAPEWDVSVGSIRDLGGHYYWVFSADSLPARDVFEASISGTIWKSTGGYEELFPQKKVFKIVE